MPNLTYSNTQHGCEPVVKVSNYNRPRTQAIGIVNNKHCPILKRSQNSLYYHYQNSYKKIKTVKTVCYISFIEKLKHIEAM